MQEVIIKLKLQRGVAMAISKIFNNKRGETIAETLVATLIASLSMVMFAGMVMASKTIIENSNVMLKEYYDGFKSEKTVKDYKIDDDITIKVHTYNNGLLYFDYFDKRIQEASSE